jgi:hypothetical protein
VHLHVAEKISEAIANPVGFGQYVNEVSSELLKISVYGNYE